MSLWCMCMENGGLKALHQLETILIVVIIIIPLRLLQYGCNLERAFIHLYELFAT